MTVAAAEAGNAKSSMHWRSRAIPGCWPKHHSVCHSRRSGFATLNDGEWHLDRRAGMANDGGRGRGQERQILEAIGVPEPFRADGERHPGMANGWSRQSRERQILEALAFQSHSGLLANTTPFQEWQIRPSAPATPNDGERHPGMANDGGRGKGRERQNFEALAFQSHSGLLTNTTPFATPGGVGLQRQMTGNGWAVGQHHSVCHSRRSGPATARWPRQRPGTPKSGPATPNDGERRPGTAKEWACNAK